MHGVAIQCVVMFADVVGSTAMYENMGDTAARSRISKALNTMTSISRRHRGKLVKTMGDEIMVYFMDADLAILAAKTIQEMMEDDRSPETVGISIRIGMQFGDAILDNDDVFGDTVNVAARVAGLAQARQILYPGELAAKIKTPSLSDNTRMFDRIEVKGRVGPLDVYMYSWEDDGEMTNMATASSFTNPAKVDQIQNIRLQLDDKVVEVTPEFNTFTFGRSIDCDLSINGDLTSRLHASIVRKRGKYIFIDQSTNGSFIKVEDGREIFLRREEFALFGSGIISLGKSTEEESAILVYFKCV
ncbi:MAG: adenylate/guanylate cyclase domain-containing protein [Gammaproteobacteria bacterium]|nr:adenylate/guanylate cyclase domain-containing protein [Gammaproteobacteria bacterium]